MMDSADIVAARGLPCRFRAYEALHAGEWRMVRDGVPGKRELVRYPVAPVMKRGGTGAMVVSLHAG